MTSIVATGEVFHGRVKELHVAPEGLVLTSGGRVVNGDIESNYADYTEIDTATSGGDKASWLRITFNDNRPAWQVSGMQIQQAEWAEQMVNEAALAAQQRDDPIYRQKVALDTLGQHLSAFGDPAAPQVAPFIDLLLVQAILHGASDVHIDPIANQLLVRYRIDGALTDICELPISMRERLIGRLKVVGGMITYRSDVPQEGRSTAAIDDRDIDARISVLPTIHGEKATIRLFDPTRAVMPLAELGMDDEALQLFTDVILRPQGTVLLTGPAGAGKTTTLYSALAHIHGQRRSLSAITTIEDPVEHDLGIVTQTETDERNGLTFAAGLRTILRQDPEVIMIGEIRDAETGGIAIQAGLTGHLILSTVHARSAAGVFARLIDIGVEPFLVASSVTAVVAQRLVRKICPACAGPVQFDPALLESAGVKAEDAAGWSLKAGGGCSACGQSGYSGRTGVFQVLAVDAPLRALVMQGLPAAELQQELGRLGASSLREAALAKVKAGVTTIDEVLRVLGSVDADA